MSKKLFNIIFLIALCVFALIGLIFLIWNCYEKKIDQKRSKRRRSVKKLRNPSLQPSLPHTETTTSGITTSTAESLPHKKLRHLTIEIEEPPIDSSTVKNEKVREVEKVEKIQKNEGICDKSILEEIDEFDALGLTRASIGHNNNNLDVNNNNVDQEAFSFKSANSFKSATDFVE